MSGSDFTKFYATQIVKVLSYKLTKFLFISSCEVGSNIYVLIGKFQKRFNQAYII